MTKHYVVVEVDEEYAERFPDFPVEYKWHIVCSDALTCEGWWECKEDHSKDDPNDPESEVYDTHDEVMLHGAAHQMMNGSWYVPYPGCAVEDSDIELSEELYPLRPGKWEIIADWYDEFWVDMCVVKEVTIGAENES